MTLISPGVEVDITSGAVTPVTGQGTVPLVFIATQANKTVPGGTGIAPGTQAANIGQVYSITSQRELLQTFGNPIFNIIDGTVQQGDETNEYGLHAAYSYLGLANQCLVVRSGVDLSQLLPTETAPTAAATNGTYWFNYPSSSFGVFVANGSSNIGLAWNQVVVKTPTLAQTTGSPNYTPLSTFGAAGDIAVSVWTTSNKYYQKISTSWLQIGSTAWLAARQTTVTGSIGYATVTDTTNNTTATSSAILHFAATVGIVANMIVADTTAPTGITGGTTVLSTTTNSVTMSGNAVGPGVGNGDVMTFNTPTTHSGSLIINTVSVSITAGTIASIAASINSASIPNVTASVVTVSGNNFLKLTNTAGLAITIGGGSTANVLTDLGLTAITTSGYSLFYAPHTSVPSGTHTGDIWIKTTSPNFGSDYVVEEFSASLNQWQTLAAPFWTDDVTAEVNDGITLDSLYVQYNTTGTTSLPVSSQVIKQLTSLGTVFQSTTAYATPSGADTFSITTRGSAGAQLGNSVTFTVTVAGGESATALAALINTAVANNGFVPHIVASVLTSQLVVSSTNGTAFKLTDGGGGTLSHITLITTSPTYVSNWDILTYTAATVAPTNTAADGTLWFNPELTVDLLVNNGNQWMGYRNYYPLTDPNGPQITSAEPSTQSNGNALVNNDLWIKSDNVVGYPQVYRWQSSNWVLIDNTDHTTPLGIVFGDARMDSGPSGAWLEAKATPLTGTAQPSSVLEGDLLHSDWMDPVNLQILNPEIFPVGMILFNTELSTDNVKSRNNEYFSGVTSYTVGTFLSAAYETSNPGSQAAAAAYLAAAPGRWVTFSGNDTDGVAYMGRFAQRACVVTSLAGQIVSNQPIRSDALFFNLIAAPGYVEVFSDLVTLNVDRKETAFIITDVPATLSADATSIQAWATNANDVANNGRLGRTTFYDYAAMYYPWALGTNVDGNQVAIPSSTVALRTYGYNDRVAYLWYPPAGARRGTVSNASSFGYIDIDTMEYVPTVLNNGQRDTLYVNQINPLAFIIGQGLLVYGDKTLANDGSLMGRVNVARLVCYLRWILPQLVQNFLFELNTPALQAQAESVVSKFLTGLVGLNALQDFVVECDSGNNTPETEAANQLWIDIAIVPTEAIDFIYVPVAVQSSITNS